MQLIPEVEHLLPLYVILGRPPGANAWQGYIEESFSMGWSPDRVRLWWSGTGYSFLGECEISGKVDAEDHLAELRITRPDWTIEVHNLADETCPIVIDLREWRAERRKFQQRNPRFLAAEPEALRGEGSNGEPLVDPALPSSGSEVS